MDDLGLPATALRQIASHLENLARQYRARAATLDQWDNATRQGQAQIACAFQSHEVLREYMAQGLPYDQALEAAAAATGLPVETIEHHWRRQNKEDTKAEAQARALEVMRLAARGLSNQQISAKTGLHPGSISRIISKHLRQPD